MLPAALHTHLEALLNTRLEADQSLAGGDIHRAARISAADGQDYFLKYNRNADRKAQEMFRTESLGLAMLGAARVIAIPKIYGHGIAGEFAFLLLEYIAPGHRSRAFWEQFGQSLATLHGTTAAQFGLAHDNFIGSLPQSNRRRDSWPEFYAEERLLPQMRMAREQELLSASDARLLDSLCKKLSDICPDEAPALTHGDLWNGNFLCLADGKPVLIDPAASFAHREMDLAMSRLFGGFDEAFYRSYEANWPLEPGFEERLEVLQLYYLLVHVNLFGGSYTDQVQRILRRRG
ncbi:MAG: fructosamine kinase family protein [Lewinellaceae bacterium]|nr:fructosamine kinase family protein [Lewinellaceae bacterium]MCB9353416.1 fructosamine kinase family protein [Lewinellaceae bacterium]